MPILELGGVQLRRVSGWEFCGYTSSHLVASGARDASAVEPTMLSYSLDHPTVRPPTSLIEQNGSKGSKLGGDGYDTGKIG